MSNNLDVVLPTEGLWRGTETQGIEDFTINLDPSVASTLEQAAIHLASKEGEVTDATQHDLPLDELEETIGIPLFFSKNRLSKLTSIFDPILVPTCIHVSSKILPNIDPNMHQFFDRFWIAGAKVPYVIENPHCWIKQAAGFVPESGDKFQQGL